MEDEMSGRTYEDGYRRAVRACVTWLHDRAKEMNDPNAVGILNTAAFNLGAEQKHTVPSTDDAAEFVRQVSEKNGGPNEKLRTMWKRYLENTRQRMSEKTADQMGQEILDVMTGQRFEDAHQAICSALSCQLSAIFFSSGRSLQECLTLLDETRDEMAEQITRDWGNVVPEKTN
jgi:hypothetical protein